MRPIIFALTMVMTICGFGLSPALAQAGQLAFKGLRAGAGQPVEVTADQLDVNQQDATAVFTGNVVVIQGEMRLSSNNLVVTYVEGDKTKIDTLYATGNVLMSTSTEAAEAETATYTLTSGRLEMQGRVLLTQDSGTISGEKLVVDLDTGIGTMEGRVKTILQSGAKTTP
jgi:lipopolysaccharide export system protein LptA